MRLFHGHLRRSRQVLHVALLQQRQVAFHNQLRHFHRPPPLIDFGLSFGAEATMRIGGRLLARLLRPAPVQMVKLLLLRRNLQRQALPQIARPHSCRIQMLHQIKSAPDLIERRGQLRCMAVVRRHVGCYAAKSCGELLFARRQITILIQVANDKLRGLKQLWVQAQSSQLPRQVIGQSRRLGEKVFKRGLLAVFILRLRAIAGVEILLEVRAKIDLVEDVFLGWRGRFLCRSLQPLLAACNLIQHRNCFVNLFQDGIFHQFRIDHLLELELVQRKNTHHLHQARRQHLTLGHLQTQFWLQ